MRLRCLVVLGMRLSLAVGFVYPPTHGGAFGRYSPSEEMPGNVKDRAERARYPINTFVSSQISSHEALRLQEMSRNSPEGVFLDLTSCGWGLLSVSGEDRLRFLHNQLTNSFANAQVGDVIESSYTSSVGRAIDLVTAYVLEDEVLLLSSPPRHEHVFESFHKYIFPLDRVQVHKKQLQGFFIYMGPEAALAKLSNLLEHKVPPPQAHCCHALPSGLVVAEGSGLALPGLTMLDVSGSSGVAAAVSSADIRLGGGKEWEALRILQGRPFPDKELTLEVTPLEAGLWHTVDPEKGCYLGQETLAKQANNKGERQRLFAVRGKGLEEKQRILDSAGGRSGVVTSCLSDEGRAGLAYIRKTVAHPTTASLFNEGGTEPLQVSDIPYATREATTKKQGSTVTQEIGQAAENTSAADKAVEAERKAKKLEEMKKRLEDFQRKNKK